MLRRSRFAVPMLAVLALAAPRAAIAADAVPLEQFVNDVKLLGEQVRDKKIGNEDLIGTLDALAKTFFNIAPPVAPPPAADPNDPAKVAQAAAAQKKFDEDVKKFPQTVRDHQDQALDAMMKALRVVVYNPRTKDNLRNDVNLKAAQVLGDLLSHADLAKNRTEDELKKLKQSRSGDLMNVLAGDFTKPKQDYLVPVAVLETTFAALARMNQEKALEWMIEEYIHTRNAPEETERLVAAHKAMKLFTAMPGKLRHALVDKMITLYAGAEAQANNAASSGATPQQKSAAAAAKAFWDKIKNDAIAAANYFATGADNAVPQNAEGQALTTMKELKEWFETHSRLNKAPWVDPKG
jgi:hypothetical protein